MACERFRDALKRLAAGGPPTPALEAHVAACDGCRGELVELRRALAAVDAELGGLASATPSPDLVARIRVAVAQAPVEPAWHAGWRWALVGGAAALLIGLALLWRRDVPQPGSVAAMRDRPVTEGAVGDLRPRVAEAPAGAASPRPRATDATAGAKPGPGRRDTPADARPATPDARAGRDTRQATPKRGTHPEVLVPAGELQGLLRYVASLERRTVTPDSLLVADHGVPLTETLQPEIRPLDIVPLDAAESSGAE